MQEWTEAKQTRAQVLVSIRGFMLEWQNHRKLRMNTRFSLGDERIF